MLFSFSVLKLLDGLSHISLLTVLEGYDECLRELVEHRLAQLVYLVIVGRGTNGKLIQAALLVTVDTSQAIELR